jgi:predicted Zn finger-like uncharacterized protein
MYTVCPKCALTLVVTAADLRVAQGFVRCGRCSNVFNALARLSEDRSAAPGTAAAPPLSQPTPPPPPQEAKPNEPTPQEDEPSDPEAPQHPADTDSIPDTALEFNPEATDVTKVFVEQAPDPQWSAATGKFKALSRKASAPEAGVSRPGSPQTNALQTGALQTGASQTGASQTSALQTGAARPGAPQAGASQTGVSRPGSPQAGVGRAEVSQPTAPPARGTTPAASPQSGQSAQSMRPVPPAQRGQLSIPAPASAAPNATPSSAEPQSIPTDEDPQFDIEVDAEFLAMTAQLKPRPPPAPAASTVQRASPQDVGSRPTDSAADTEMEEAAEPHPLVAASATSRPPLTHLWGGGTAALVMLLAVQIIHHYRHDLAANERLYKPLTALYSALGVSLVPRWNLEAYDVRQLGASADSGSTGQLTVRASVKNTAKQAQPLPLLRVTLQDRFGNRIAARDVPPTSYLPSAVPASSFLSAGQRIDAEMAFVDPGSNAVGFEIDACLPRPGGSIACANDAAR